MKTRSHGLVMPLSINNKAGVVATTHTKAHVKHKLTINGQEALR